MEILFERHDANARKLGKHLTTFIQSGWQKYISGHLCKKERMRGDILIGHPLLNK